MFAYLLVRGQYIREGPVVLLLSEERGWGVHRGEMLIAGGWLVAIIAIAPWCRTGGRTAVKTGLSARFR